MKKLLATVLAVSLVIGMFSFTATADSGKSNSNGKDDKNSGYSEVDSKYGDGGDARSITQTSVLTPGAILKKAFGHEDDRKDDHGKKTTIPAFELNINTENALLNKEAALDHSVGNADENADKILNPFVMAFRPAALDFTILKGLRTTANKNWDAIKHLNTDIRKAFEKFRNSLKTLSTEAADQKMVSMKAALAPYHATVATIHKEIKNLRTLKEAQWKLFRAAIQKHGHQAVNKVAAQTALTEITRLKGEIIKQQNLLIIAKNGMLNTIKGTITPLPVYNIVLAAENFNTNKGTDYYGVSVGYMLNGTDLAKVASVTVALYSGTTKIVENVTKSAEKAIANPNGNFKYSSAFIVKAGLYSTSSTWNFGAWTPARNMKPTRAVITVRDINGVVYTAENNALSEATATWDSLFASDIVVVAENFNTNKSPEYWGATFGYALSGTEVAKVASVKVSLYSGTTLLVENTSKSADKVNVAKQYSTVFFVLPGTYTTLSSSTWNFGTWLPGLPAKTVKPTKAVVTITDISGYTYAAENAVFLDALPAHDTWESLFP